MILSFRCEETQALFEGKRGRRFANIAAVAQRKLTMLDAAHLLVDLLEPLIGNRDGQYSIRINVQWRVCFVWTDKGPKNVEIIDYH